MYKNEKMKIGKSANLKTSVKSFSDINISFKKENIVSFLIYTTAFILPFFFLPSTIDELGLNKTYLVIILSAVAFGIQALRSLLQENYKLNTIENYYPLLGFLLAGIIATFYSTNRFVSLFGTIGKYEYSLLSLLGLTLFAFVVSNEKLSLKKVLLWFANGAGLVALLSIFIFLNIQIPGLKGVQPGFNLVGDLTNFKLVELLSSASFLYYLSTKQIYKRSKIFVAVVLWFFSSFATLMYGDLTFILFYLVLTFIILIYAIKVKNAISYIKKSLVPAMVALALAVGLIYIPATRAPLGISTFPSEARLSINSAWSITASVIKTRPLIGSGLGTFSYDVSLYKPAFVNATNYWNLVFNRAPSDLLLVLSTMGITGLLAYLFFWIWLFKRLQKIEKRDNRFLLKVLVSVLFVSSLFFSLNIVTWFMTFIIVGLVIQKTTTKTINLTSYVSNGIVLAVSVLFLGFVLYQAYPVYKSQYHFRKSLLAQNYINRYKEERIAIETLPKEAFYRDQNAKTAMIMALALSKSSKDKENSDVSKQVSSLVKSSILESRIATEVLDPNNVRYWETRAFLYSKLIGLVKDVEKQVIGSATTAMNLEPVNPRLWLSLGNYYYATGNKQLAGQSFAKAVQLKNDYANAHYNLALVLVDLKTYKDALIQLQITERLVIKSDKDTKLVRASIEKVAKLLKASKEKNVANTVTKAIPENARDVAGIKPAGEKQESLSEPGVGQEEVLNPGVDVSGDVVSKEKITGEEAPLAKPSISQ